MGNRRGGLLTFAFGAPLQTNGPAVWTKIGMCHQATGDLESAKECYENGKCTSFSSSARYDG